MGDNVREIFGILCESGLGREEKSIVSGVEIDSYAADIGRALLDGAAMYECGNCGAIDLFDKSGCCYECGSEKVLFVGNLDLNRIDEARWGRVVKAGKVIKKKIRSAYERARNFRKMSPAQRRAALKNLLKARKSPAAKMKRLRSLKKGKALGIYDSVRAGSGRRLYESVQGGRVYDCRVGGRQLYESVRSARGRVLTESEKAKINKTLINVRAPESIREAFRSGDYDKVRRFLESKL